MRIDWRSAVGLGLAVFLLWWLFRGEDLSAIAEQLAGADSFWLVTTGLVVTSGGAIQAIRWRLLLEELHGPTTFRARWASLNIGFMVTNVLPARLGEIARPVALSRMAPVSMAGALGTVVVERILDVLALMVLLLVALLSPSIPASIDVGGQSIGHAVTGAIALVLTGIVGLAVVMVRPGVVTVLLRPVVNRLPDRAGDRLSGWLDHFVSGLSAIRRAATLVKAMLWSLLLWVWWSAAFWTAFRAFGLDLGLTAAVFTQCAVALFIALPAAPGFVGVLEAGVSVSLHDVFGVPLEPTLALAVGYHLVGFIPVTLLGLFYAWSLGLGLRSIRVGQPPEE